MKTFTLISSFLLTIILTSWGQNYDDVYYQPSGSTIHYNNDTQNNNINYDGGSTGYNYNYKNQDNNNYGDPNRYDYIDTSDYYTDDQGNTYITNNYYNDDNYDFFYTSRMRRFYNPHQGFGWYSGIYTDPYWYGYNDPWMWGSSIYVGSGFFVGPTWGWSNGWCSTSWATAWAWGRGYNYGWGNGWYGNYGWNTGWSGGWNNGYWNGYNHGYNHGYTNGYWDGYGHGLNDGIWNTPLYNHQYRPRYREGGSQGYAGGGKVVDNPIVGGGKGFDSETSDQNPNASVDDSRNTVGNGPITSNNVGINPIVITPTGKPIIGSTVVDKYTTNPNIIPTSNTGAVKPGNTVGVLPNSTYTNGKNPSTSNPNGTGNVIGQHIGTINRNGNVTTDTKPGKYITVHNSSNPNKTPNSGSNTSVYTKPITPTIKYTNPGNSPTQKPVTVTRQSNHQPSQVPGNKPNYSHPNTTPNNKPNYSQPRNNIPVPSNKPSYSHPKSIPSYNKPISSPSSKQITKFGG